MNKKTINSFFACHENYGDLLYPIMISHFFNHYKVENYGLVDSDNSYGGNVKVKKVIDLINKTKEENHIIFIGGGAILRNNIESSIQSHLKLKKNTLNLDLNKNNLYKEFKKKYLPSNSIGPFILNEESIQNSNIIYFSCGFGSTLKTSCTDKIVSAFSRSKFIYVRDYMTKEILLSMGLKKQIHVAPDVVTMVNKVFPLEVLSQKHKPKCDLFSKKNNRKILIFQCNFLNNKESKHIIDNLNKIRDEYRIVLMPAAMCHNDHLYLQYIANEGNFEYFHPESIFDIIYNIAKCDFVISTSMHFAITAFSYNKPFVVYSKTMQKIDSFLKGSNLNKNYKISNWLDLNNKVLDIKSYFERKGKKEMMQSYNSAVKTITNTLEQIKYNIKNHGKH